MPRVRICAARRRSAGAVLGTATVVGPATRPEPVLNTATAMLDAYAAEAWPEVGAESRGLAVEVIVRLTASHIVQPGASPEESARRIAEITVRTARYARPGGARDERDRPADEGLGTQGHSYAPPFRRASPRGLGVVRRPARRVRPTARCAPCSAPPDTEGFPWRRRPSRPSHRFRFPTADEARR
ncbi:hypothetical protein [Streptomyces sp. V4I23]|uniref:hypothetical protein n=1 Tax=Streptomyces sp. V4I23 TaxID=3042282 RepID=UPI00358FCD85